MSIIHFGNVHYTVSYIIYLMLPSMALTRIKKLMINCKIDSLFDSISQARKHLFAEKFFSVLAPPFDDDGDEE